MYPQPDWVPALGGLVSGLVRSAVMEEPIDWSVAMPALTGFIEKAVSVGVPFENIVGVFSRYDWPDVTGELRRTYESIGSWQAAAPIASAIPSDVPLFPEAYQELGGSMPERYSALDYEYQHIVEIKVLLPDGTTETLTRTIVADEVLTKEQAEADAYYELTEGEWGNSLEEEIGPFEIATIQWQGAWHKKSD